MIFIPQRLVVEGKSFEQTYKPVLDFSGWKIALSPDVHIIIVDSSETSVETTDYAELSPELVSAVKARFTVKG